MSSSNIIADLLTVIESRKLSSPDSSYVASLMQGGVDKILSKITEESNEVCEAANQSDKSPLIHEICDLLFHTLVLAGYKEISYHDIANELQNRFGTSGHVEKAQRHHNK